MNQLEIANYLQITCHCRYNTDADMDTHKGIVADSGVYDLPDVHYVWGLPLDVFHLCFEGITKLMLVRMFVKRTTKESKMVLSQLSHYYENSKVFSEMASTTRPIRVKQFKGNELRVLTMSAFPILCLFIIEKKTNHW